MLLLGSLQNKSNEVRWSLDLRWQRPGEPEGLHGIQRPVPMRDPQRPMRDPQRPGLDIDWSPFEDSRHFKQAEYLTDMVGLGEGINKGDGCISV